MTLIGPKKPAKQAAGIRLNLLTGQNHLSKKILSIFKAANDTGFATRIKAASGFRSVLR